MSGHSKWSTIKRQKAAADAKRGNIFTKLANAITVAAKEGGGEADKNFKLRLEIERAKSANMPKGNIERAIKKGTGELKGEVIEELSYGALLPGQVPLIVKCLTDNKNRSLHEVKTAITKNGGQMTDLNAAAWHFEDKGVIRFKATQDNFKKAEELELAIIDSGADNYELNQDEIIVYTKPKQLQKVRDNLEQVGVKIDSSSLELIAKNKREIDEETTQKISKILNALDELDDVNDYYTNII